MTTTQAPTSTQSIEFELSFGGFYEGSLHGALYDSQLEAHQDPDNGPTVCVECQDRPNWQEFKEDAARDILDYLAKYSGVELEFMKVWSPKEYNHHTDEIDARISRDDFEALAGLYCMDSEFIEWTREAIKSRPGYSSGFSSVDDLIDSDINLVRYIYRYIVNQHQNDENLFSEWVYCIDGVVVQFAGCDCDPANDPANAVSDKQEFKRLLETARVSETTEHRFIFLLVRGFGFKTAQARELYRDAIATQYIGYIVGNRYDPTPLDAARDFQAYGNDELDAVIDKYGLARSYRPTPTWQELATQLNEHGRKASAVPGGGLIVKDDSARDIVESVFSAM